MQDRRYEYKIVSGRITVIHQKGSTPVGAIIDIIDLDGRKNPTNAIGK